MRVSNISNFQTDLEGISPLKKSFETAEKVGRSHFDLLTAAKSASNHKSISTNFKTHKVKNRKVKRIIRCSSQSKTKQESTHRRSSCAQKKVAFEGDIKKDPDALATTYMQKLDRQHVLAAKERITIQKFVNKISNGQPTGTEQESKKQDKELFFRQATKNGQPIEKDPVATSHKIFGGLKPAKGYQDPIIKALVGKEVSVNKEISFDERINRMFTKLATNAVRHKNNFRHTNYDLDRKVTRFMKEREERLAVEKEQRRVKEEKIPVIASSDEEDQVVGSLERKPTAEEMMIECERSLKRLFLMYPAGKTQYDEECMDLCIPYEEAISKDKYQEITGDSTNVDQIAAILVRYNNFDPSIMEDLCFVIPKIDPLDFKKYRDGLIELRKLRSQILGISNEYIVNMDDIDVKVDEFQRDLDLKNYHMIQPKRINSGIKLQSSVSTAGQTKTVVLKHAKSLAAGIGVSNEFSNRTRKPSASRYRISKVKSEIRGSSIDSRFVDTLDQQIHPRLLIQALKKSKAFGKAQATAQQQQAFGNSLSAPRTAESGKVRTPRLSVRPTHTNTNEATKLLDKGGLQEPTQASGSGSGRRMLTFEKGNSSILMIPEDITAKRLFYMQMQELESIFNQRANKKASSIEQDLGNSRAQAQVASSRTEQVPTSLSQKAGGLVTKNSVCILDPEKQARLLAQQKKIERQMAKDEANRQHKLQQKAQDQFHKRLIFSDEHNLVSDRLKDEKMGHLLSTQESYSHSHLVSDPVLRITQSGFKPKKPRPRDILQESKKHARRQTVQLKAPPAALKSHASMKNFQTFSSLTPVTKYDTVMTSTNKGAAQAQAQPSLSGGTFSKAVMDVDMRNRRLRDYATLEVGGAQRPKQKQRFSHLDPSAAAAQGVTEHPRSQLYTNMSADRKKVKRRSPRAAYIEEWRPAAESPNTARIAPVTDKASEESTSQDGGPHSSGRLVPFPQQQLSAANPQPPGFMAAIADEEDLMGESSGGDNDEIASIQKQLDKLQSTNERNARSMATLKEAVEKEVKYVGRPGGAGRDGGEALLHQMSDYYQLKENCNPDSAQKLGSSPNAVKNTAPTVPQKWPQASQPAPKRDTMSAQALPQRPRAKFAMRPQSGVPLASQKVIPKNQEKSTFIDAMYRNALRTDGFQKMQFNSGFNQPGSATHADERSTQPSQPEHGAASGKHASGKASSLGIKARLFSAKVRGQNAQQSLSGGMTDKKSQDGFRLGSMSQVDVSDRLATFAADWGIPIQLRHQAEGQRLRHKQHQFMFQTRQAQDGSRNVWNQRSEGHQKIVEEITMEAQENTVQQLKKPTNYAQGQVVQARQESASTAEKKTRKSVPQSHDYSQNSPSFNQQMISPLRPISGYLRKHHQMSSANFQNTMGTMLNGLTTQASASAASAAVLPSAGQTRQQPLQQNPHAAGSKQAPAVQHSLQYVTGSGSGADIILPGAPMGYQQNNAQAMVTVEQDRGLFTDAETLAQQVDPGLPGDQYRKRSHQNKLPGANQSTANHHKGPKLHGPRKAAKKGPGAKVLGSRQTAQLAWEAEDPAGAVQMGDWTAGCNGSSGYVNEHAAGSRQSLAGSMEAATPAWEDTIGVSGAHQLRVQHRIASQPGSPALNMIVEAQSPAGMLQAETSLKKNNMAFAQQLANIDTMQGESPSSLMRGMNTTGNFFEKIADQAQVSAAKRQDNRTMANWANYEKQPHHLIVTKVDDDSFGANDGADQGRSVFGGHVDTLRRDDTSRAKRYEQHQDGDSDSLIIGVIGTAVAQRDSVGGRAPSSHRSGSQRHQYTPINEEHQ